MGRRVTGHARRFQLLRLRTKANPTRTAPQKIPTIPTLVDRIEVPNRFITVPPVGSRYMSKIPPPIKASPITNVSHSTVSLWDAEPSRLIAELRTDHDLPSTACRSETQPGLSKGSRGRNKRVKLSLKRARRAGLAPERLARAQVLLAASPFIFDHSASCASLFCCLLSARRLSCSLDHQAKHMSPMTIAETSPFCSSRRREVPLLTTRWPRQSLM